jgi:uncharacterized membrane protein YbhN (UPF0104 family)
MKTANESSAVVNTERTDDTTHKKTVWQRWWPWLRRLLTLVFFGLVAWLLVSHARSVDWQEVKSALLGYSPLKVGTAIFFAFGAYLVYSCYDLFGRHFIKAQPSRINTMTVAFISFAFNLNLGALIGSIGLRYRMYSRLGLGKAQKAHIVGM